MKVGFISLGCSKNLIDTEMAIGLFKKHKYSIVNDINKAEIIVINTCGFIESAKQEAINTILETAKYKINGNCKYIIVIGCLVERYEKELKKELPEVDLFIPIKEYNNIWEKIEKTINKKYIKFETNELNYLDRVITTGNVTAYLKIAEGCSNRCTYCAIPYIRGPYVSRPFNEIIKEAHQLAENGYKEIILIAQDTTKYGIDIYGEPKLAELLEKISTIKEIKWIRFLYAYPESITDELIETVKNNKKICKYLDIPIQHISNTILKKMNRKSSQEQIENLITKIKKEIPEVILRTSLIVGFPGETEDDFNRLYKFIEKANFDKLGVFKYSKEDGTPAEKLPMQINQKTKDNRYNKIMKLAQKISKDKLQEKKGKEYEILIETLTSDKQYYVGRTYMDIPETDGITFVYNTKPNLENTWQKAKIMDVKNYDLIAKLQK